MSTEESEARRNGFFCILCDSEEVQLEVDDDGVYLHCRHCSKDTGAPCQ